MRRFNTFVTAVCLLFFICTLSRAQTYVAHIWTYLLTASSRNKTQPSSGFFLRDKFPG